MKEILKKYILFFFSIIIFGGLLWGLTGLGQLLHKNWNIVNLLLGSKPRIEGLVYIFIGLCTLTKFVYNILWDRPKDPPHIIFILFIVVASGVYWGIIGTGLLFGIRLDLLNSIPGINSTVTGILYYTIGIFALLKLSNYIYSSRD